MSEWSARFQCVVVVVVVVVVVYADDLVADTRNPLGSIW